MCSSHTGRPGLPPHRGLGAPPCAPPPQTARMQSLQVRGARVRVGGGALGWPGHRKRHAMPTRGTPAAAQGLRARVREAACPLTCPAVVAAAQCRACSPASGHSSVVLIIFSSQGNVTLCMSFFMLQGREASSGCLRPAVQLEPLAGESAAAWLVQGRQARPGGSPAAAFWAAKDACRSGRSAKSSRQAVRASSRVSEAQSGRPASQALTAPCSQCT